MNWNYMQPVRIRFGNGLTSYLPEEIKILNGQNGLLITSASFVKKGLPEKLCKMSGGTIKHVYGHVSANPDIMECEACTQMLRENSCDFVVALGGGSVMDCAKAAATLCLTDEPVENYLATGKRSTSTFAAYCHTNHRRDRKRDYLCVSPVRPP